MSLNFKPNPLKKKLARGEQSFGCWVTLAHPLIPELLAPAGFDWLCVDMEHSSIDLGDLLPLIISIEANGMVPLVRVGENDPNLIKRVMDAGAYGVIVANVNSVAEAKRAVDAVKYPPVGKRGVGLYRAQGYGRSFEAYKKWLATQSVVVVQIEHKDALPQIDGILSVPGVDAFLVGPYDLSGSMGKPGRFDDPDVKKAIRAILAAGKRHKCPAGFHAVPFDVQAARSRVAQGFKFLGFSLDGMILSAAAAGAMRSIRGK